MFKISIKIGSFKYINKEIENKNVCVFLKILLKVVQRGKSSLF